MSPSRLVTSAPGPPGDTNENIRRLFVALAGVLVGVGVLMVYSASITAWPTEFERVYLSRHLVFLLLGAAAAAVCTRLSPQFWLRAAPLVFWLSVALLGLAFVPGIGHEVNGARRWLRLGPLSLQPSELAKLALPLMLCRLVEFRRERLRHWILGTLPIVWPVAVVVPLILFEPDLGTTAFLLAIAAIALLAAGWPLRYFIVGGLAAVPAAVFLAALRSYQWQRITGFLATWSDAAEAPYQLRQSLLSLGEGGLLGVGLGRGWQKLSFLPEANTDFVFAVVGEELGLVATLAVILVWTALYAIGLRLIAPLDRHGFRHAAAFALLTQVVLQAALNVAVVTAMVPPKGIAHPLLSYGGSSLVSSLMALGIVLALTRPPATQAADGA